MTALCSMNLDKNKIPPQATTHCNIHPMMKFNKLSLNTKQAIRKISPIIKSNYNLIESKNWFKVIINMIFDSMKTNLIKNPKIQQTSLNLQKKHRMKENKALTN